MNIFSPTQFDKIISALRLGQVGILPSESSYGLSCAATNQTAVEKIFKIKNRDSNKSVLVLVKNISQAKKYLKCNGLLDNLAKKYWSESCQLPLTIVGEYKKSWFTKKISAGVVSSQNTIAVRVTKHQVLSKIISGLGEPLVSTSANLADAPSIYDAQVALKEFSFFENQPDFLVDCGILPPNEASTIVSVVNNELEILRQGELYIG